MQNISFQGRTNLILSENLYNSFLQKSEASRRTRSLSKPLDECKLLPHKPFAVHDCNDLIVIIRNERDGFMKKFPVTTKIEKIAEDICRKIDELQASSKEKLTAWIFGGTSYKKDNGKTIEAVNEIGELLCDRPDIDTSILAGPRFNTANPIGINGKIGETEIIIPKGKNIKIEQTDELENFFDIVELNNVNAKID